MVWKKRDRTVPSPECARFVFVCRSSHIRTQLETDQVAFPCTSRGLSSNDSRSTKIFMGSESLVLESRNGGVAQPKDAPIFESELSEEVTKASKDSTPRINRPPSCAETVERQSRRSCTRFSERRRQRVGNRLTLPYDEQLSMGVNLSCLTIRLCRVCNAVLLSACEGECAPKKMSRYSLKS